MWTYTQLLAEVSTEGGVNSLVAIIG